MAEKEAKNFQESYEKVITVIRCRLSLIILRSALLCIRGSRSNHVLKDIDEFSLDFDSAGLWGGAFCGAFCSLLVFRT